jgi:hypothetical protein
LECRSRRLTGALSGEGGKEAKREGEGKKRRLKIF